MKLSIKSAEILRESFERIDLQLPPYTDRFLTDEFEVTEIHDILVQEVQDIVNALPKPELIAAGACVMMFNLAAGNLKKDDFKSAEGLGDASQLVMNIVEHADAVTKNKFVQVSNFYYGIIFSILHDHQDPFTIAPAIVATLDYAHKLKNSAMKKVSEFRKLGYLDICDMEKFRNVTEEDRDNVNKGFAVSSLLMSVIGTFVSTVGKSILDKDLLDGEGE